MADLTITAANVGIGNLAAKVRPVQVGEAVSQGQPAIRNATDGKYYQGDANDADLDDVAGIFLTAAGVDGYALLGLPDSDINLGATLTVGVMYYLSETKGGICLYSDLTGGNVAYVTPLGTAISTSLLRFNPQTTGIQKP